MKKIICVIAVIVLSALFMFPQNIQNIDAERGVHSAAALNSLEKSFDTLSEDAMQKHLEYFLAVSDERPNGSMGIRAPFSEGELETAKKISDFASGLTNADGGFAYDVKLSSFSTSVGDSQNVIIKKTGTKEEGRKQIIFGANYDNALYEQSASESNYTISLGAMDNGTGCALLIALMDYYKDIETEHDLVFIFFGADKYSLTGSYHFAENMSLSQKENTLIMFNVKRFGGDNLYIYSEEQSTAHNEYLYELASASSQSFTPLPKNLPIISAVAVKRIPYAHWAMIGSHSAFMNENINVANIFSGNLNTANVSDLEAKGLPNRSNTVHDTYQNLKSEMPAYKRQMSEAAQIIVNSVADPSFETVMITSRLEYKSYAAWTNELAALIALLVMLIVTAVAVVLISKRLEKKYPPPQKKQGIKLAVFGTDYEEKNSDDIFIDFK